MSAWNFDDLTGKRFGRLLVESRAPNSKNGRSQWNCICDCDNEVVVLAYNLKNGNTQSCGCLQCQKTSEARYKDIIGNRYGRLTVIERKNKNMCVCVCDCGNIITVKYCNLISGNTQSCGCLQKEILSNKQLIDLSGQHFGELTVIKRVSKIGAKTCKWLCICTCGMYTIVDSQKLRNGHTQSCGHLKTSKPESIIVHYLNALEIDYKKEFMFDDLLSKKGYPLRFDFKINYNGKYFLLEYQGQQHYRNSNDGFGKQQREITDKLKKEYCKLHNIELVEIKYTEDIIQSLEKILKSHNLLQDNPVPSL